jgi:Xaa-Pro aminopeptidase
MFESTLLRIREAIRGESLDGWLFWNFHHRDRLSDELLGLSPETTNSRPWLYAVPAQGEPLRIVHAIEVGALDELIGEKVSYSGREEFLTALAPLVGKRWGAHISKLLPIVSYMDEGTAATLRTAGLELQSAAALIQRLKGLLDDVGIASHESAAEGLYAIVRKVWTDVDAAYRDGTPIGEGAVRRAILDGMAERGLVTDHPPIVAAGAHAGDPHYDFAGDGDIFHSGDVIQLDLWAKHSQSDSIYADISWVGVFGESVEAEISAAFSAVVQARDLAVAFIDGELAAGRRPSGASVDEKVRASLIAAGYGNAIRHRTGHGIDTECHGSGANLDSAEFPDERLLLEGSCFSVEPGLYFDSFGVRTEIDAYIRSGRAVVSGGEIQRELLFCGRKNT